MLKPYPYQEEGLRGLLEFYSRGNHGAILADEPGLGKTVQAIMLARSLACSSVLVVCPSKLKLNWKAEFEMWAPGVYFPVVVRGRNKVAHTPGFNCVTIINYDILKDTDFGSSHFDLIIYDEGHRLRNPEAKWTQAAAAISATRRVILTGTPIINRPRDVWQLLLFCGLVKPEQFHDFGVKYCQARQEFEFRSRGRGANRKTIREATWVYDGAANLEELNYRLHTKCMIRRYKKDVLPDLPPKTRRLITLPYHSSDLGLMDDALRRLRNATAGNYDSAVRSLKDELQLAFDEISLVRRETALQKVFPAYEYILDALDESPKIVVFAHHRDVLDELSTLLWEVGMRPVTVMGGTTEDEVQERKERFQNDPGVRVFLGQIQACGEGLTLTAASRVIFVELDWTPAGMTQCEDRCHRIGQDDNVLVEHLVFENTIDAKIAKALIKKQKIIESSIDRSVPATIDWLSELS